MPLLHKVVSVAVVVVSGSGIGAANFQHEPPTTLISV